MYTGAAQASRTNHFIMYTPCCALHLWWHLTYFW